MMRAMQNAMRAQAQLAQGGESSMKMGLVSGYDPNNYCAKVMIQPDNVETGWLPVASAWIGNGWGLFAPPSLGDMVEVHFQEGDLNSGVVGGRLYNDSDRPLPCPSGEFWLVHKTGAYIKLLTDGSIKLNSTVEIDAGNLGGTLHTLVHDAFMALYNGHTHPDAQGGNTGAPSQQMGASHMTTILKGN